MAIFSDGNLNPMPWSGLLRRGGSTLTTGGTLGRRQRTDRILALAVAAVLTVCRPDILLAADAATAPRAPVGYTLPLARALDDTGSERTADWLRNNGVYTQNASRLAQGGGFVSADQLNVASSNTAGSAGFATSAGSASTAGFATSAGTAASASWATSANWASGSDRATSAGTADRATTAGVADRATSAGTADRATTAASADFANISNSSNFANFAQDAATANNARNADNLRGSGRVVTDVLWGYCSGGSEGNNYGAVRVTWSDGGSAQPCGTFNGGW